MKKGYKILLIITLVLSLYSVTSNIKADSINGYIVSGDINGSYNSLSEATQAINLDGGTNYLITLTSSDDSMTQTAEINSGKIVTLKSAGTSPLTIKKSTMGRHIKNLGTLTIENITLDSDGFSGGVRVIDGKLTMNSGASIINGDQNVGGSELGGGVQLDNSYFTMNDGLIENNKAQRGGGVDVGTSSTLEMNGGVIKGNEAGVHGGGGVGIYVLGTFIMNGGELTENISKSYGGGAYAAQATHVSTEPTDWCRIIINDGLIYKNEAMWGAGLSAQYNGNITVNNGEIFDNHALEYGGGILVNNSIYHDEGVFLNFVDGKIYGNIADQYGGGILVMDNANGYTSTVTIGDPILDTTPLIYSNSSTVVGGGLTLVSNYNGSHAIIHNAHIYSNSSLGYGGGIALHGGSHLTINKATIGGTTADKGNTALHGGGISTYVGKGEMTIYNAAIENNSATSSGGGIYLDKATQLKILDDTSIISNIAGNEGGGIYTTDVVDYANLTTSDYQNIQTSNKTIFKDNKADNAYLPPSIVSDYTNIQYQSTSIINNGSYLNPINNYDINFVNPPSLDIYTVIYDANGGIGSYKSENIIGEPYYILSPTDANISRANYVFEGWSLTPNGEVDYESGDLLTQSISKDEIITLYAKWVANPVITTYTVTFDSNGGSSVGSLDNIAPGSIISKPSDPTKANAKFMGWFLDNNTFENEWNFSTDTVNSNITLYAKWVANPVITTYTVTFDSNGGSSVGSLDNIAPGSNISKPSDPTKANAKFMGWFLDNNTFEDEWNFSVDTVNSNITLYAKWEVDKTTVPSLPQTGYNNLSAQLLIGTLLILSGWGIVRRKEIDK